MHTMTIHQAACPQLVAQLERLGLPADEVLAEAGLQPIHVRGEERAPLCAFMAAKGVAARRLGDPYLGVRLAAMTRVEELEAFGAALVHVPTIGRALAIGLEFLPVWVEGVRLVVGHGPRRFTLTYEGVAIADPLAEQIEAQQTTVFLADTFRLLAGPAATPQRVSFACPAPTSAHGWHPAHDVGREWQFDAPAWSIEMPREVVDAPVSAVHPAVPTVLRRHLEGERRTLVEAPDLLVRVDDAIRRGFARRWSQADVAAVLGMSVRVLQKRLHAAGTCYSQRLDAVRVAFAVTLLRGGDLSVEEVGRRVGFGSLPGFSRFFTAQTGSPPSRHRRGGGSL